MRFLLDTNAVIAVQKRNPAVLSRLREHHRSEIGFSSIVAHELFFGAYRSDRAERNVAEIDVLGFQIIEFDGEDARVAGLVRSQLADRGTPIGPYDVLIAGQALARGLTLVTRNRREFDRVDGLAVEDWQS